ncbi:putative membrane protein [Acinetobacter sp. 1294596]|nr:putative membrane protein [Acinetobacter sp. 1294596]
MVIFIKAFIKILPLFLLLVLLLFVSKSCQQSACESKRIYCD